jgi:cytochrome c oxidase assembly factor CtaG
VPHALTIWNADPLLWLALLALGVAYYAATGPLAARIGLKEPATRRERTVFGFGLALLALTLVSPLDTLGRTDLFSAHMLQLMLLNSLVAPLLLLGLPEAWGHAIARRAGPLGEGSTLLLWAVATLVFNGVFLLWHAGPLYEMSLSNEIVHNIASLTLLLTGLVRWWPVLTPEKRQVRLAAPGQMIYILLESLPIDIFAVVLIFAPAPLYATYLHAPHFWGVSALLDQQIAGCIALIPGTFADFILISIIFFAWLRRVDREQEAEDERVAALEPRG